MIDQENAREYKVMKGQKVSMLFSVILFLIMGSLCFIDELLTKSEMILIFIFTQSATAIAAFITYSNFKMRIIINMDKLIYNQAFRKRKEIKYHEITNIKLFALHGLKIRHTNKYYFISEYIVHSHEFLKLLYEKIFKYNPEIIDKKVKRNFEKKYRYMLWRNFYYYWFKKNYLLILITSLLFGVISAFVWKNYYRDLLIYPIFPFLLPFYWFLLSYFVYSLKLRKLIKAISIEDSIDSLYNDYYNRSSYKKYFIVFTIIIIFFCILSYVYF